MTTKLKTICDFYAITHKLKELLRIGPKVWQIDAERFESVAEHIYGTQMLALAISSEFEWGGADIGKVCLMLSCHELGETIIGDLPVVGRKVSGEQKHDLEREAIEEILAPLTGGELVKNLWLEFEENKTKEAKFARFVDKLECDFQIKFYDETGCADIDKPRTGDFARLIAEGKAKGFETFSKMWIEYDKQHFAFDELFSSIADFVAEEKIFT